MTQQTLELGTAAVNPPARAQKYSALRERLEHLPAHQQELQLSFAEIEQIIGAALPPTAWSPGYWTSSSIAHTNWRWLGFQAHLDRREPSVVFTRSASPRPLPEARNSRAAVTRRPSAARAREAALLAAIAPPANTGEPVPRYSGEVVLVEPDGRIIGTAKADLWVRRLQRSWGGRIALPETTALVQWLLERGEEKIGVRIGAGAAAYADITRRSPMPLGIEVRGFL